MIYCRRWESKMEIPAHQPQIVNSPTTLNPHFHGECRTARDRAGVSTQMPDWSLNSSRELCDFWESEPKTEIQINTSIDFYIRLVLFSGQQGDPR